LEDVLVATDVTVDPGTAAVSAALCEAAETAAVPGIAVLFALEREVAPFRRLARGLTHVSIHVSGVGRRRARVAAEQLLRDRLPKLVIAAGFCGALVPTLRVGDVVSTPRIVTVDHLVTDLAEKRRLGESHDAVDMESSAIAEVCAARGVAFRAVRAVSDTVDTALSPELVRLLSGGNVSVWKACGALVRKPALLSEFLRLARDTRLAARKLAEALVQTINAEPHGRRPWGSD
jgi:adenosylhomocysteine nucleosidase